MNQGDLDAIGRTICVFGAVAIFLLYLLYQYICSKCCVLRIIYHNHPSAVLYPNQWRSVSVVGLDAYGNRVLLDPQQWCLKAHGSGLHQGTRVAASDERILECCYLFDEPGTYKVQVKSVDDALNDIEVPDSFSVKVSSPPLDPQRCAEFINRQDEYFCWSSPLQLLCKNIHRSKLTGDDGVNVQNINRVLDMTFPELNELIDYDDIETDYQDSVVHFRRQNYGVAVINKVFELVCLLVESIHYRDQANKFNKNREEWKVKAMDAYNSRMHDEARECSAIKEKYAKLMNECHRKASDAIFHFYNYGRSESEIDLHGQLVANEEELHAYRNQLLRKKNATEVERIIEKERNEMDEAIRRLGNIHVDETREGRDWLEIIVGAGHHSRDQCQKIRPRVEQFLNERNIPFIESNKGALLITYREYKGRDPCYATFYCKKCNKVWPSNTSWKGLWQKCFRCDKNGEDSKCYPFKLRSESTSRRRANYRGTSSIVFTREDHVRLCQKCQDLGGRDCSNSK